MLSCGLNVTIRRLRHSYEFLREESRLAANSGPRIFVVVLIKYFPKCGQGQCVTVHIKPKDKWIQ
jgi:hypothetical protein